MLQSCTNCGCIDSHINKYRNFTREGLLSDICYHEENRKRFTRAIDKRTKQITFWQGKYNLVKHENNKLRKKLYNREKGRLEKC